MCEFISHNYVIKTVNTQVEGKCSEVALYGSGQLAIRSTSMYLQV